MIRFLLFALFFVLLTSQVLGFDVSLAPGLSTKNAFIYVIFTILAIQTVIAGQRKLEMLSVFIPFGLYVCYAIFSWLVMLLLIDMPGYDLRTTMFTLKAGPVEHLLILLIFFYGTRDSMDALRLLRNIVWLVIVVNAVTVIDALDLPNLNLVFESEDGRVEGPVGQPNTYGAFLVLFLPAIIALYLTERGFKRVLAGLGALVTMLALLMTVSRAAMVGLAGAGALGAFYLRSIIPRKTILHGGIGAVVLSTVAIAGVVTAGYGDTLLDRFLEMGSNRYDASSGRTAIWGRALSMMVEKPVSFLTGFGWDAYSSANSARFATHNTYLNILFNLGAIGLSLFLLAAGNAIRQVRIALTDADPEARTQLLAFIFGFLALLGSILFGELQVVWLFCWAFVGISLRLAISEVSARHEVLTHDAPKLEAIRH